MEGTALKGYRLSAQQRLAWAEGSARSGGRAAAHCVLCGPLDPERLVGALEEICRRHEILRTRLASRPGLREPVQVVEDEPRFELRREDWSALDEGQLAARWESFASALHDPSQPPLSVLAASCSPREHHLLLALSTAHCDRWSFANLLGELVVACGDGSAERAEEPVQYLQYAHWCAELAGEEDAAAGEEVWRQRARPEQPFQLPWWSPPEPEAEARRERLSLAAPGSVVEALGSSATALGCDTADLLATAWALLLARHQGADAVTLLAPFHGRKFSDLETACGPFEMRLPVRLRLVPGLSFAEAVGQWRRDREEVELWQEHAGRVEPSWLAAEAGRHHPSFAPSGTPPPVRSGALTGTLVEGSFPAGDPLLELRWREGGGAAEAELVWDGRLLSQQGARHLLRQWFQLLAGALAQPDRPAAGLPLPPDEDEAGLQPAAGGGTVAKLPWPTVQAGFEHQAAAHPEAPAVADEHRTLSYRQLEAAANRLAHRLRQLGVGPEIPVGLCLGRSVDQIVALLAVLKAGGAYLPIDPDLPTRRQQALLEDTRAPVLVATSSVAPALAPEGCVRLDLDREQARLATLPAEPPAALTRPENLAYVLFTSGSTGRPKGVAVEHRQLLSYLAGVQGPLDLSPGSSFAHVSSFAADLGNTAIFPALLGGGCLYVASSAALGDPDELARQLERHPADCLKIVPSHLQALLGGRDPARILPRRLLVLGGEAFHPELLERVHQLAPACRILGHYGPTETTVGVMAVPVDRGPDGAWPAVRTLGRALPGSRVHLVEASGAPAPVGIAGELLLAGGNVARGYFGRPALTAERFLPDPWSPEPGARLYRSGDLGRRLPDGRLRFEGRLDHQVKIRGFRVEPGEVDALLLGHPAVTQAVTVARADGGGELRLVSYVVVRAAAEPAATEPAAKEPVVKQLRRHLGERLPPAMVPESLVVLDRLPLNANGKVDLAALPPPDLEISSPLALALPPRDAVEETVAGLWSELLGGRTAGPHDSFFDLGGHSLLVTQLLSRLRAAFDVDLELATVFENPTLAGQAAAVARALSDGVPSAGGAIERQGRDHRLPLSFAQERLWFMDQLQPGTAAYNVARCVRLTGRLAPAALARALAALRERHESLRTVFLSEEGRAYQVVQSPEEAPRSPYVDLGGLGGEARAVEAARLAGQEARRPFDLARGPLLRLALLRLGPDEHQALLTLHHVVSDAWSMAILIGELGELYAAAATGRAAALPELPVQYGDFAVWQRRWAEDGASAASLDFWRRSLAGLDEEILRPDRPRPAQPTFRGEHLEARLSQELSAALSGLARQQGVTLFMLLLAGLATVLHRATGRTDLAVGTDVANRNRLETERLIGFFVNHLVLRCDLSGDPSFTELLRRVKKVALGAYQHQDLPFDQLVKELRAERKAGQTPLFQVLLVLQNAPRTALVADDLVIEGVELAHGSSKFDLALFVAETPDGLELTWTWRSELFHPATVGRLASQLEGVLAAACAGPESRLSQLALGPAEPAGKAESPSRLDKLRQVRQAVGFESGGLRG
ncbi:MAG TPA: amino acid adenylation domain-containing protein [Thermoanaerobaculia bacterium]|nr:amino acid adenylation domain-containing protein [Thermoanaerobaculia bacterium]